MIDGCHVPPTSFGDHLGSFTQITQNQHQFYSVSSVLSPGLISRPHDLLTILVDENLGPDPLDDCPARKSAQTVPNTVRPIHSEDVKVESAGK